MPRFRRSRCREFRIRIANVEFRDRYVDLRVLGKGRKERVLTLWRSVATSLRAWLKLRPDVPALEMFLNARGEPLTRAGVEYILSKHVNTAKSVCPSLGAKRVSPHVLRHTCAVATLQATDDIRKVALWLGHASQRTTEIYLQVDPTEKLETLNAVLPPKLRSGRFRAPDQLIAMLQGYAKPQRPRSDAPGPSGRR